MFKRLLFVPILLGGAFLVGNVVAERAAESALSDAAGEAVGLGDDVQVDIRGFPLLLQVFQGRVDAVEVSVSDRVIEDLRVSELAVQLEGIRADGQILGNGPLTLRIDRATASAVIEERAIQAFLKRRGHDVTIDIRDGEVEVRATRSVFGRKRTFTAVGPIILEGEDIVFRPREVSWDGPSFPGANETARRATTVREELPSLPADVRLTDLAMKEGFLELAGSGGRTSIRVR